MLLLFPRQPCRFFHKFIRKAKPPASAAGDSGQECRAGMPAWGHCFRRQAPWIVTFSDHPDVFRSLPHQPCRFLHKLIRKAKLSASAAGDSRHESRRGRLPGVTIFAVRHPG